MGVTTMPEAEIVAAARHEVFADPHVSSDPHVSGDPHVFADVDVFADLDVPAPLEARFGDPTDPDNPLGYAAFLDADERGDLLPAGEHMLDGYLLNAEFVPRALGGRLARMDQLGRVLRPLFGRDGALALGHGASNLVGAVNVWTDGDGDQQRCLADVLLANGRISAAYTDLDTGNDVTRSGFQARPVGDGWRLSGRKEIINNIGRAEAITVLARTGDEPGSRSHSLMLLDRASLPRTGFDLLPRYRTVGVRAMYLGGMVFRDCPVPRSCLVGGVGGALETILRAFQVTRSVLPSAALGGMDSALRTVVDFAVHRRLYGRRVIDLPHARAVLAGAFVDLLACDSLATVGCRGLHLLPRQTSMYAAAVKYIVPLLLRDAVDELAVVLGARSFLRSGRQAIFQKHLRDLPVAALVHAGGTICQATMIPQLPRLSRGWLTAAAADPALFQLDAPLPDLDLRGLAVIASGHDALPAVLWSLRDELGGDTTLRGLCDAFVAELGALRERCSALPPRERSPLASADTFAIAHRYAVVLAAAACLGVWYHSGAQPNAFIRDDGWVVAALSRLAYRLGRWHRPADLPESVVAELLDRYHNGHAFDLVGRALAGWRPAPDIHHENGDMR
jgi:alkylation response protein AidB-like acyl-CoA dehydrogenase